uniref:Wsv021-like protein n=1 Tax=Hemigrapsus takanoi nimavirus TaxID=2133792 RepID=A0A401IP45_9VIRU|nr:MAG: wsv021-like protein [Hemigrapsus takanoi nimavirus]GBG35371.1 wsv021-like protein [Hemigrapsus takanoi nimavirus]
MEKKIERILGEVGEISKRVDWPSVVGIFTIVAMVGLMVAIIFRHQFRMAALNKKPIDYYNSKHLPVAFLEEKTGKVKDMWLTPNEFVAFGGLYKMADNMRHGLCTDDATWIQFGLFAAAKAFRELKKKDKYKEALTEEEPRTIRKLVAKSVEDTSVPYLRFLSNKFIGVKISEKNEEIERVERERYQHCREP